MFMNIILFFFLFPNTLAGNTPQDESLEECGVVVICMLNEIEGDMDELEDYLNSLDIDQAERLSEKTPLGDAIV